MSHFLYKFVPYQAGFPATMTDAEAAVMSKHVAYWQTLADKGAAVVFGLDSAAPSGSPGDSAGSAGHQ